LIKILLTAVAAALLAAAFSCIPSEKRPGYRVAPDEETKAVSARFSPHNQDLASYIKLKPAVMASLDYVRTKDPELPAAGHGSVTITWGEMEQSLERLLELLPLLDGQPWMLSEQFTWLEVTPEVRMTGYYEPILEASAEPDPKYPYPLYATPDDLRVLDLGMFHPRWEGQKLVYRLNGQEVLPYHDRGDIDFNGTLKGRGLEIAWVADPVDVFFLHIQGSGRLKFPNGQTRHVLYDSSNGRQYVSLGREMIQRGVLEPGKASMQAIRAYFRKHPEEMDKYLPVNPSYVFFRLEDDGPYGASGAKLTPFVSAAVDPEILPLGAILAIKTHLPRPEWDDKDPFYALLLAQDVGGAIKGERLDLFCGAGDEAGNLAGRMHSPASVYMLVSKDVLKLKPGPPKHEGQRQFMLLMRRFLQKLWGP